ncbi:MAG: Hsp70 family protein, partial [Candidatus Accumulibacter sp.]|nr:Hsp70 family protein [Accumulibacter sp.]
MTTRTPGRRGGEGAAGHASRTDGGGFQALHGKRPPSPAGETSIPPGGAFRLGAEKPEGGRRGLAARAAGELAGLKVERLLNEPTAAALAYGLHETRSGAAAESRFAVLDLGGGTFDVSVLEFFEGVMEVRASAGDNFLGGEDFVDLLAGVFMEEAAPEAWKTGGAPPGLKSRVRSAATKLLHKLSDAQSAEIQVVWENRAVDWKYDNEAFAKRAAPLLERLRTPIERALRDSRFKLRDLDDLLLVGGATRITIVRQAITRLFG